MPFRRAPSCATGPHRERRSTPQPAVLRSASMGTDTRLALRRLAATPLFTAFAILSLAAGVAITTTTYSIVDGVFLRGQGIRDPDRLAVVVTPYSERLMTGVVSEPDFRDLEAAHDVVHAPVRVRHVRSPPRVAVRDADDDRRGGERIVFRHARRRGRARAPDSARRRRRPCTRRDAERHALAAALLVRPTRRRHDRVDLRRALRGDRRGAVL